MTKPVSRTLLEFAAEMANRLRSLGYQLRQRELLKTALSKKFVPRNDDIYIVSYPKSGTTLMQMMLHQLTSQGETDMPHIEAVSPFFQLTLLTDAERLEALPSPRLLKSHLLRDFLPSHGRFIYLARQVRDVALSSYHHKCLVEGIDFDLSAYLDEFIADRSMFGSWFKHISCWWPLRNDENVLFLLFEEVIADLEGTARRVARFCDLPADEEHIARAVRRTSLGYMKQHTHFFDPRTRRTVDTPAPNLLEFLHPGSGATTLDETQRKLFEQKLDELGVTALWNQHPPPENSELGELT